MYIMYKLRDNHVKKSVGILTLCVEILTIYFLKCGENIFFFPRRGAVVLFICRGLLGEWIGQILRLHLSSIVVLCAASSLIFGLIQ